MEKLQLWKSPYAIALMSMIYIKTCPYDTLGSQWDITLAMVVLAVP